MKLLKLLTRLSGVTLFTTFLAVIAAPRSANADPLKEARVTQIIKDVNLLPEAAAARPAAVNDDVRSGTAVRTGIESRTELTFPDKTLTRLGAQTVFSFGGETRTLNLGNGALLLSVPKNSGGAKIKTAALSAAISGTTVVFETHNFPTDGQYHPPSSLKSDAWYKFLVLEGEARFCRDMLQPVDGRITTRDAKDTPEGDDCVIVHAGEMLTGRANQPLPALQTFDIAKFVAEYVLINGFPPLPQETLDLIAAAASTQPPGDPPGITVGNVLDINPVGTINPGNTKDPEIVHSPEQPPVG